MSLVSQTTGRLYGIGIGPGDPELLTIKALRILQASPVVAYPISDKQKPLARSIIAPYLTGNQIEVPMLFPFKLEESAQPYYDSAAEKLAEYLNGGQDVVVLCEGDPFFYGSFMYLYTRLSPQFHVEVVPGVSSIMASASALGAPLTYRNDVFMVLSSILSAEVLTEKLAVADAAVIIKLGKHFRKVYGVLKDLGLAERAKYIERATTSTQVIMPLEKVDPDTVPYFSLILIPSKWQP
ncbi:precorrin-2 C(20)-methyltransferase [Dulcicalothrix desertica PCC 7102]|uniref:Precorrin-2 C(20)-methyltransferase n=1 Tax=Dulcicalothrix desertica PCC 7102 TaxID=232991 RepID=A0A433VGA5_9CYAN|nr:precorrin-2 C(20)-methyltransferase [Dulcicalothrix desertica]RUT05100.1 precorrin-2 C(20)-methyltransferase [Dulcicalothrix desertica PCC 7102]TWH43391.1 precorrin-2/cobalt-factor-2 C20-methyltransferase [Dulcicalothrix desertica PCC 7102]